MNPRTWVITLLLGLALMCTVTGHVVTGLEKRGGKLLSMVKTTYQPSDSSDTDNRVCFHCKKYLQYKVEILRFSECKHTVHWTCRSQDRRSPLGVDLSPCHTCTNLKGSTQKKLTKKPPQPLQDKSKEKHPHKSPSKSPSMSPSMSPSKPHKKRPT